MSLQSINAARPAAPAKDAQEMAYGLPAWAYRNAELLDLEYQHVILPSWQFACHANEIKTAGDYVTFDLGRDSVIVMRDKDQGLRAFKNVCRHRGARLLDGSGSCRGAIVCPYHGWSYGFDGSLEGTPNKESFPGLVKQDHGLLEVELEVFSGLVFVRLAGEGPSLKEMWGDYAELLAPYGIDEMEPLGGSWTETWNCNWKIAVDNNLENYHVPIGHPGYHRMLDNDLQGFMNAYGVSGSKSVLRDKPSHNWTERFYQELAPEALDHLDEETRRTWFFFSMPPNIGLDIYPDSFDVFQILPLTAETCVARAVIYARPGSGREERLLQYLNQRINRQVGYEDQELCERVQQGMGAHGYEPGPLAILESGVRDFHDRIRAAVPAVNLEEEPAPGTLTGLNQALRGETQPAN
ncbi:MAG: aromatic ring-hydroxylating dioxygenase subunit alpha [Rhodovibrionaceae bacterium]